MRKIVLLFTALTLWIGVSSAFGQFGTLKKVLKKAEKQNGKSNRSRSVSDKTTGMKKNGRIVFSKRPIDPKNPTNLTTKFNAGDHIYGLIILDMPLREYINYPKKYPSEDTTLYATNFDRPYLRLRNKLNGAVSTDQWIFFSADKKEGALETVPMDKYFFFDIAPEASKQQTYKYKNVKFPKSFRYVGDSKPRVGPEYFSRTLGVQGPGTYTFDIVIEVKIHEGVNDTDQVSGSFTVSGNDFAFYKKVANDLSKAAIANVGFPKSKWRNVRVGNSIKAAYRKAGKPGQIVKISFDSPGWNNQRNRLGLIEYRSIGTYLGLKHRDGTCEITTYVFRQDYRGRNRFGATRIHAKYDSDKNQKGVPCTALSK